MPSRRLSIDQVRSAKIHQAFEYWRSIRGGKAMPARRDLDPVDIPHLLPYVYLTEIHREPLRIRYRLVGTMVCEIEGRDKTGLWMHEEAWLDDYEIWLADYRSVMETRQPLFGQDDLDYLNRGNVGIEWAVFPLADDGETVDMTFELEIADNEQALLREPLSTGAASRPDDQDHAPEPEAAGARMFD